MDKQDGVDIKGYENKTQLFERREMYYIAKKKDNGEYALFNGMERSRTINNAHHFTQYQYRINKDIYRSIGYIFYKVLEDGTRRKIR